MSKWRVSLPSWEIEIEAEDEEDALAACDFDFMTEARAEEIGEDDGEIG